MDNKLITTPFSEGVATFTVAPGQTISDVLKQADVPFMIWDQVVVTVNTIELARDQWEVLNVREDDSISIYVTQQGGDDGKSILRIVAIILVAVAAAYIGQTATVLALSVPAQAAVVAGITVVGTLAVNALIPPPSADLGQNQGTAAGNSYFLSGQENRARFYEIIPIVYGTHKMVANLASSVDVFNAGTSSVFSGLYDFGLGGVTLAQLKAGDTDLSILSGQTRRLKRVPEYIDPSQPGLGLDVVPLNLMSFPVKYQDLSIGLNEENSQGTSTTSQDCTAAVVEIAFPQGLLQVNDNGDELYATVQYEISWRPVGGIEWFKPPVDSVGYGGTNLRFAFGYADQFNYDYNQSSVEADVTMTTNYVVNDGQTFTVRVSFRSLAYRADSGDDSEFALYDPDTGQLSLGCFVSGPVRTISTGRIYEFDVGFQAGYVGRAHLKMDAADFLQSAADNALPFASQSIISDIWRVDMTTAISPPEGEPLPEPPPGTGVPRYSATVGAETYVEFVERRRYPFTGLFETDGVSVDMYVLGVKYTVALTDALAYKGELVHVGTRWVEIDYEYRIARYATKYHPVDAELPSVAARSVRDGEVWFTPEPEPGITRLDTRTFTIKGNKAQFGVISIVIPFPAKDQYEVRIVRKTAASDSPQKVDKSTWSKLNSRGASINSDPRSILNLKKQHTLLELQFEANENISGNVQQISAVARGEVRTHDGVDWQLPQITSNPAWIVLDILTGYSIQNHADVPVDHTFDGGWIKDEQIDFDSFLRLASVSNDDIVYTDAEGRSLTRPRYACNLLTATDAPIIETAQSILSMARAQIILNQEGKYAVMMDEIQATPRQLFTPQNSWGFTGTRTFGDMPHAFDVEFTSPELGYQIGSTKVYRPGYDASNSTVFETLQTFGITNWHQASWYGMYMLAQGFIRSELFTMNCDLENLVIQRGDMVHVQHDVPLLGGLACVVTETAIDTQVIKVDQQLSIPAQPWGYTLRKMDGTVISDQIADWGPDYVNIWFPRDVEQGEVIVVGTMHGAGTAEDPYADVTLPYVVTSITPKPNLQAEITLVKYDEDALNTDWGSFPIWDPAFGEPSNQSTNLYVDNLAARAGYTTLNRLPYSTTALTWDIGPTGQQTCKYINVSFRDYSSGKTGLLVQLNGNERSYTHEYLASDRDFGRGYYTVEPISNLGFVGTGQTITVGQVVDNGLPPAPENLVAYYSPVSNTTAVSWDQIDPEFVPDIEKYDVYYSLEEVIPVDLASEDIIYITSTSFNMTELIVLSGIQQFYYVVAVDTSNNQSLPAVTYSVEPPNGFGIGYVPDFTPGYVGGTSDFVYILNSPNPGDIEVNGFTLMHPDGTEVSLDTVPWWLHTFYEGSVVGTFYIMYTAENPLSRFIGSTDWGLDQDKFISIAYDTVIGWQARENDGTYYPFTPLATDCIVAACYKNSAESAGIEIVYPLTGGLFGQDGVEGPPGNDGVDGADGADGADGVAARAVSLAASTLTFQYDYAGNTPSPSTASISASPFNITPGAVVWYKYYIDDVAVPETQVPVKNFTVYTYTPKAAHADMPQKFEVEIYEGTESAVTSAILARDQITLAGLREGSDAFTVAMSNEAHTMTQTAEGFIDYGRSGTTFKAWQGIIPLTYDDAIEPAPATFKVVMTGVDPVGSITPGSINGVGYLATVNDHSNMTQDNATIDFDILLTGAEEFSTAITIEKVQSLSKSIEGQSGNDALGSVPAFYPGFVGGTSDFTYSLNTDHTGAHNDGEIRVNGTTFVHPDGTVITVPASPFAIFTAYEGEVIGKFYIMYTLQDPLVRFPGSTQWGVFQSNYISVVFDDVNLWRARENDGTYYPFTPLETDCIIAICNKTEFATGIEAIIPITGGLAGLDGADGQDGSAGLSARSVDLTADSLMFEYDAEDLNPTPASVNITATANNITPGAFVYYKYFIDDVSQGAPVKDANIFIYTPEANYADMPQKFEAEIYEGDTNNVTTGVLARDQITLAGLKIGSDAISIVVSNEAHTLPTTNLNVVTYTGSGTDFKVWQGAVQVPYSGTLALQPSFKVAVTATSSITANSAPLTVSTYTRRYGVHNSMTADNASITYTVTVKTADGQTLIFNKQQSFAKSRQGAEGVDGADGADGADGVSARGVNLTIEDQSIEYGADGLNPSPASAVVTATAVNTIGTVYYQFFLNDSSVQNTSSPTYNYVCPANIANMPQKIEVQIREGSTVGTILARDQITVSGIRPGADGVDGMTVILSNEAHSLPQSSTGVITYTGSGTNINVWEGTDAVPYDGAAPYATPSFRVSVASDTDILVDTTPVTVSTYTRQYSNARSMTASTANIVFNVTVVDSNGVESVFTKTQTFSKSVDGADGSNGSDGGDGEDAYTMVLDDPLTLSFSKNAEGVWSPSGATTWLTGVVQQGGLNIAYKQVSVTRADSDGALSYSINDTHSPDIDITISGDGTNALTVTWKYTPVGDTVVTQMTQTVTSVVAGVGGTGGPVAIRPQSIFHNGNPGVAGWSTSSDGWVRQLRGTTSTALYEWLISGSTSDYQIMWQHVSGGTAYASGSALRDTWLSMTTQRLWKVSSTGSETLIGSVSVRRISDSETVISGVTISLTAEGLNI